MVSEELAPLEAHVQAQVKHLSAVAGVVRELQSVEKQYADGYAALPLALPADAQSIIVGLPQLQRVTEGFSQFVHKSSVVKATVVEDLSTQVIAPLEAFIAEHVEKSQHLLSELYELLQKEKAFDVAYQNLLETCEMDRNAEPAKDNSTDSESVEAEVQLHRAHMEQLLRKRDAERLAIQQWITALHFAGQRYEAHVRNVVQQVIAVYDRMVAALTMLAGEYQGCAANRTYSTIRLSGDNNSTSSTASEEGWASFVAGYECHVTITSWMSELFKQLIPTEQKFAKDMKKATKLDRSLCKTFSDVGFSAQFAGFVQFHGLLTMNISNPIMRTLKFSKERQERMRNELVKSLEETRAHIDVARARLNARLAKEKENVEETPVRCDSMTSSETSECSVDDNNEEDLKETEVAIEEEVSTEPTPEQINLDTLERKLVLQRQEMTHVFEQTSYLSVKTLELMVQDHLKHVIKALGTLKETMQAEFPDARCEKSNTAPQPWYHITERLAITVTDQPAVVNEDNKPCSASRGDEDTAASRQLVQIRSTREICEPKTVQVALSAAQTAVGVGAWAATVVFKAAGAHLPPSFEERAVLAAIMVMILAMINICVRSSQLQHSWSDLTDTHRSNSDGIMQVVMLSFEQCTQVNVAP